MNQRRVFYLDFIRVVSILFIFIYHFNIAMEDFNISVPFSLLTNTCNVTLGHIGVFRPYAHSGSAHQTRTTEVTTDLGE